MLNSNEPAKVTYIQKLEVCLKNLRKYKLRMIMWAELLLNWIELNFFILS